MCDEKHSLSSNRKKIKCIHCGLNLLHVCTEYQSTSLEGMFLPVNSHSTKCTGALISLWDLWESHDSRKYYRKQWYTKSLTTLS